VKLLSTLVTPKYSFRLPLASLNQDPITVVATSGQSRVVVARPYGRPHVHKTRAPGVLPLHEIPRRPHFVR
jgi:hypothetical protein